MSKAAVHKTGKVLLKKKSIFKPLSPNQCSIKNSLDNGKRFICLVKRFAEFFEYENQRSFFFIVCYYLIFPDEHVDFHIQKILKILK